MSVMTMKEIEICLSLIQHQKCWVLLLLTIEDLKVNLQHHAS